MNDFASEAMLRLVRAGLLRQGLLADGPPPARGAHVALTDKRAWLDRLYQVHGPDVIVRLGEAVHGMDEEPLLIALSLARDPPDLLQRWQRLERFVHSRHRVRVTQPEPGLLRMHHVSLDPLRPPTSAEDLLVFGFLVALCEYLKTPHVRARPVAQSEWSRSQRQWRNPAWPRDVSVWEMGWQSQPETESFEAAPSSPADWIAHVQERLAADPGRSWTVDALARETASSPRTLQRRLAHQGLSFTRLLSNARLKGAARLLAAGKLPTAQVGYVCGFADQAHFTRQFKQHTAMTPVVYRNEFAQR